MIIMLAVGFLFAVLGVLIKHFKWYFLISGYNTMSKERKKQVDIEALGNFLGNYLFLIAGLQFLGAYLLYINIPEASQVIPLAVVALIIYMLVNAQKYDSGALNPDGTMKISTKLILGTVFILFVVLVIFIFAG